MSHHVRRLYFRESENWDVARYLGPMLPAIQDGLNRTRNLLPALQDLPATLRDDDAIWACTQANDIFAVAQLVTILMGFAWQGFSTSVSFHIHAELERLRRPFERVESRGVDAFVQRGPDYELAYELARFYLFRLFEVSEADTQIELPDRSIMHTYADDLVHTVHDIDHEQRVYNPGLPLLNPAHDEIYQVRERATALRETARRMDQKLAFSLRNACDVIHLHDTFIRQSSDEPILPNGPLRPVIFTISEFYRIIVRHYFHVDIAVGDEAIAEDHDFK